MASSLSQIRAFTRSIAASPPKIRAPFRHTTRRPYRGALYDYMYNGFANLLSDVSPSVVALKSYFDHSSSSRAGTGVFVRAGLLVTSAHVVGRVVGAHCEVGRTAAITAAGKVLQTRPLAVNLGGDVAVLLAVGDSDSDSLPPPSSLASEIDGTTIHLTAVTRHDKCHDAGVIQLTPSEAGGRGRSHRREWIHPVEDGFGWARYGSIHLDEVKVIPGSPWFGLNREVVGIASWAAGSEPADSNAGFVVPPPRIRAALDYGATRGPNDPVVMDRWIEATTVSRDYDAPIINNNNKACVGRGFVTTWGSDKESSFRFSKSVVVFLSNLIPRGVGGLARSRLVGFLINCLIVLTLIQLLCTEPILPSLVLN